MTRSTQALTLSRAYARIDEQDRRLRSIAQIIEHVDLRCMATDGPVADTRHEMTADEMRQIYRLASGTHKARDLLGIL